MPPRQTLISEPEASWLQALILIRSGRTRLSLLHQATGWSEFGDELRSRGLRWTPQRRLILDVVAATRGHVTGREIVERCLERDAETTPSTVYRTLDVLEDLGYLHHSHGADGREEFHVLPATEHAHLQCERCGRSWEMEPAEAEDLVRVLERSRGFTVHLGHLTIAGECRDCTAALAKGLPASADRN